MTSVVFCGSMVSEFSPIQLIHAGKTTRCHPLYDFPQDWEITHTPKHWSNEDTEDTMLSYIENVFVRATREHIGVGEEKAGPAR